MKKNTKAYQAKILKRLKNKCLKLWKICVKNRDGNKCVACGSTKQINAHHIESYNTHKNLRYEIFNGVSVCPGCHKFFKDSFHQSFIFAYKILFNRVEQFQQLLTYQDNGEQYLTPESMQAKINQLISLK